MGMIGLGLTVIIFSAACHEMNVRHKKWQDGRLDDLNGR